MQFERDATAHHRRLLEVVAGEAQFSELDSDERRVAHALIDANIARAAVSQRFGPSARRSGQRTVSLDDDGNLILDIIAGPNGTGKTTLFEPVIEPGRPGLPFVDADRIASQRWPGEEPAHSYEAASIAAAIALHLGAPLNTPAKHAGQPRRCDHHVRPPDRYSRLWPLVAAAPKHYRLVDFYGNSHDDGPVEVASCRRGTFADPPRWPGSAPEALTSLQPITRPVDVRFRKRLDDGPRSENRCPRWESSSPSRASPRASAHADPSPTSVDTPNASKHSQAGRPWAQSQGTTPRVADQVPAAPKG